MKPARVAYPRSTCRTCGAAIVWAITVTGARMPVDFDPADRGNVALRWEGTVVRAAVHAEAPEEAPLRWPHHATCTNWPPKPTSRAS